MRSSSQTNGEIQTMAKAETEGTEPRRPWRGPASEALPRSKELTLPSAIEGSGIIDGGGASTVF